MRRTNNQLKIIPDSTRACTKLTDTSGNPSESYHWSQIAAVWEESQHEFGRPYKNGFEVSLAEITSIETQVRKELYP